MKCPVISRTFQLCGELPNMAANQGRSARIEARISPEALAMVRRAAEIEGRSVSDFVVSAAQETAKRTIEEATIIQLSLEDQERMANAIIDPPEPTDALRMAFEAYKRMVVDSR